MSTGEGIPPAPDLEGLGAEVEGLDPSGDARRRLDRSRLGSCPPVEELVVLEAGRLPDPVGSATLWAHIVTCTRCTGHLLDLRRVARREPDRRRIAGASRWWIWLLFAAAMAAAVWWARQADVL